MRVGNESKLEFRGCDTDLDPMLIAKQQKEGEKKAKCGKGRCQQVLVKRSGEGTCIDCEWSSSQTSWYACNRHEDVACCMNCTAKRQFPWLHSDPLGSERFRKQYLKEE